jgi:DNA-binding FadR family transcriptional regulator
VAADHQFHQEIARATQNHHFTDLMNSLGTGVIPRARIGSILSSDPERLNYLWRVNQEHESIYNAIAEQDVEAARAAMRTHLANSRERLRKSDPDSF